MAFYVQPCAMNEYWRLDHNLTHSLTVSRPEPLWDGDILRLVEADGYGNPTGHSMLRLVIRTFLTESFLHRTSLILVPLDHPFLQQLELTSEQGTFVFWVGSPDRFTVGDFIRLQNLPSTWEISQTCTTVPPARLPEQARVGFLTKGEQ